jgi:hypothetical protein
MPEQLTRQHSLDTATLLDMIVGRLRLNAARGCLAAP